MRCWSANPNHYKRREMSRYDESTDKSSRPKTVRYPGIRHPSLLCEIFCHVCERSFCVFSRLFYDIPAAVQILRHLLGVHYSRQREGSKGVNVAAAVKYDIV